MPTNDDTSLPVSTLVPGFLVSLRTSVTGNVKYSKEVIEAEHKLRSGEQRAKWMTEKLITDPEEHTKANQARMKARQIVASVCAKSAFGYLCPENREEDLKIAMREARRTADAFNRRSRLTAVSVYIVFGKIARDDVEAARAIKSEVRELVKAMSEGVRTMDAKIIRESANKLRDLKSMLAPTASAQVVAAIEAGRGAARKIVKAGEEAASEIDRDTIRKLTQVRSAFLDMEDVTEVSQPVAAAARAVDLDPNVPDDNGDTANDNDDEPTENARFRANIEDRVVAGTRTGRIAAENPPRGSKPKKGNKPLAKKGRRVVA